MNATDKTIDTSAVSKLIEHVFPLRDKSQCFPYDDQTTGFVKSLGVNDPEEFLDTLINEGILEEPLLGKLRFTQYGYQVGGSMNPETKKQETKSTGTTNTGAQNTGTTVPNTIPGTSKQAGDTQTQLPYIDDVLPSGEQFSYPLLDVFLGEVNSKEGDLEHAEIITGSFGDSACLCLNGVWYRSSSQAILGQIKKLLELGKIPVRVNVARATGKTGRVYHTLRGKRA
jgi:hypothetical protein